VSAVDVYGNARPYRPERRRLDAFGNEAQRRILGVFQEQNRRILRRGGEIPFALPGHLPQIRQSPQPEYPQPGAYLSPGIRQRYDRYGGFESRPEEGTPGDVREAFTRRKALIEATALNAPVHRARVAHGAGNIGLPPATRDTLLGQTDAPAVSPETADLDDWLGQTLSESYSQAREEGWSWFRKGREENRYFRRAARAFESALILDPADFESRIGEIFSHLSVGGLQTAMALLGELTRRDPNPFSHQLDLVDLYGDPLYARQVRLLCETNAQANRGLTAARALHVFVTWHIGEQDRAIAEAEALQREQPQSRFARWVSQMRAIRTESPEEPQP